MEEKETKLTITLYTESLFQSLVADLGTFLMLSGMFYVNAVYIQSKLFMAMIVIMFALKLIAYFGGRKNVFTSRADAIEFLKSPKATKQQ